MGDDTILQEELRALVRIRVHQGKTQVWNRMRFPSDRGRRSDQGSPGSQTRSHPSSGKVISICWWIVRVLRVSDASIGTQEHVMRQLKAQSTEHAVLLERIPVVAVVHAAWLLLLCRGSKRRDDENVSQCLRRVIGTAEEADRTKWDTTLPFSSGGPGLGICSQNQGSRTLGEFGGLSRDDPQLPLRSGSLHHDLLDGQSRAEFRGTSDL